ncbi:MAG: exodeoxyribonuclease VII small subunit [Candidatus Sericytochromatia bacterium]|nr:exodeoxyribonuclease VII small subunit [Candidatus Sericytochromatia bacterium]
MNELDPTLTYRQAFAELGELVHQLEQAKDLEVDALPAKTRRAAELLSFCQQRLTVVEKEVGKTLAVLEGEQPEANG